MYITCTGNTVIIIIIIIMSSSSQPLSPLPVAISSLYSTIKDTRVTDPAISTVTQCITNLCSTVQSLQTNIDTITNTLQQSVQTTTPNRASKDISM